MINNIVIRGEIIEEIETVEVIVFKMPKKKFMMAVSRRSGVIDRIPVIVLESQVNDLGIRCGDRVQVEGTVISFHKDGHLQIEVVADFIMKTQLDNDMNEFKLSGYICREPVHRFSKKGVELTCFMIANEESYIPVVSFFEQAAYLKDCALGKKLDVVGRLQSRHYIRCDKETGEEIENREYLELAIKELQGVDV